MTPRVAFHLALVLSGWCAGANGWAAVAWACIVGLLVCCVWPEFAKWVREAQQDRIGEMWGHREHSWSDDA